MPELSRIMLVTDRARTGGRDLIDQVERAVAGGVALVQVREKDLNDAELIELIERIRDRTAGKAQILVNDRPDIARRTGCGLHLPASHAEAGWKPVALVGCSVHDDEEIEAALSLDPGYLIVGTVFPTLSKPGRSTIGTEELSRLVRLASPLPVFGIGGIDPGNAANVISAGCYGVALCGALLGADEPEKVAAELCNVINRAGGDKPLPYDT